MILFNYVIGQVVSADKKNLQTLVGSVKLIEVELDVTIKDYSYNTTDRVFK